MGYIAGAKSKQGEDVSQIVLSMLEASSKIRGDSYGFASPDGVEVYRDSPEFPSIVSDRLLGYKQVIVPSFTHPQPLQQDSMSLIFQGHLWDNDGSEILDVADQILGDPRKGLRKLVLERDGSYALAVVYDGGILCVRDVTGTIPLYYGESETHCCVASNRKMLWRVGLKPTVIPPGSLLKISSKGVEITQVRQIIKPRIKEISMGEAVEKLEKILTDAVEKRARGIDHAYLGFSGGLDSGVLAYLLERSGVEIELISVGIEGEEELEIARKAAEEMGLSYRSRSFPPEKVEETLEQTLLCVEEPNPMKIGVAMPQIWAAEEAVRRGRGIFYSGNGSDELFGGYMKFVREYLSQGGEVVDSIYNSVINSHRVNFERDYKVYTDRGLELRLPFTDTDLVEFGLSLPLELKLPSSRRGLRKRVLRRLANRLDIPEIVAERPKKAVQYSTGVNKILLKLSKEEDKRLHEYLEERFKAICLPMYGSICIA